MRQSQILFIVPIVLIASLGFGAFTFFAYSFMTVPANGVSCSTVESTLQSKDIHIIRGQAWGNGNSIGLYNLSEFTNLATGHVVTLAESDPYGHAWVTYSFESGQAMYFFLCGTEEWR